MAVETDDGAAPALPELPVVRAAELDADTSTPLWLVQNVWLHLAVGWCAGLPKSMKTTFALDVATSVASGTPCLGQFLVEQPGPVLIFLAEDALPRVRDRIVALCAHRGVELESLPLYVITAPRLRLDSAADRERLENTVARLARLGLRLIVFDPLVRLHGCDESSAPEMSALLGFLRELSRRYGVALIVVHHMTKRSHHRLGQGLRGSGDLWAWSDSAAYLVRRDDDTLRLTLEHRSAPAPEPLTLALVGGSADHGPHLELLAPDGAPVAAPLAEQIRRLLRDAAGPLSRAALRRQLRVNNHRLGEAITALEQQGAVERTDAGWTLRASATPAAPAAGNGEPAASRQVPLPLLAEHAAHEPVATGRNGRTTRRS